MGLEDLGWNPELAAAFEPHAAEGLRPARIAAEHTHIYRVYTETGICDAVVAGQLRYRAERRGDFPAVGDWVALEPRRAGRAIVRAILPRKSKFSRKRAGLLTEEQIVAANVDVVFLMAGLDDEFNVRRLERYLILARESGADPVILLNKADLSADPEAALAEVRRVAPGVPVHHLSLRTAEGLDAVRQHLARGRTIALLGSSGVGKSTLINRLLGVERQRTREVRRQDSRGRHTTTFRELILLPQGGLVIDTPGMREIQLWGPQEGLREVFEDIDAIGADCFFQNCRHRREPRCAVKTAVSEGRLSRDRLESYHRLQDELQRLAAKQDKRAQLQQKRIVRSIHRKVRDFKPRE
ncbi:MAG: ribosome small subunit-dependent GTPase A [Acidobacteria bacterium]|nr:ribosome small subunit-dependent GTPase A [Acidobacteriota bacterium]